MTASQSSSRTSRFRIHAAPQHSTRGDTGRGYRAALRGRYQQRRTPFADTFATRTDYATAGADSALGRELRKFKPAGIHSGGRGHTPRRDAGGLSRPDTFAFPRL